MTDMSQIFDTDMIAYLAQTFDTDTFQQKASLPLRLKNNTVWVFLVFLSLFLCTVGLLSIFKVE